LISTQASIVLLVVVFQGGTVRQRMLTLKEPATQDQLNVVATKFNTLGIGADAQSLSYKLTGLNEFETDIRNVLQQLMTAEEAPPSNEVYRDGLTEVLREPEFEKSVEANQLVTALEQPSFLSDVLNAPIGAVQVVIGGEGRWRELSSCSVVIARYGVEGFATGTLGVLGPTRMPYGRAISTVRYVTDLMSDMVSDLYGE
jgi:heat-inducible transcriptional repressor